nr:unnamed protein product [Callosobruchus chinensis]
MKKKNEDELKKAEQEEKAKKEAEKKRKNEDESKKKKEKEKGDRKVKEEPEKKKDKKDRKRSADKDTLVAKDYNAYHDDSTSSESVSKSDRIRVKDTTRKTYDMGLDIYKPLSYHGPRFAEKKPLFTTDLTSRTATVGCRIK